MPYPANAEHFVMRGNLPGGERWATGMWRKPNAPGNAATSLAGIQAIGGFPAFITAVRAIMAPASSITTYDLYQYGAGGTAATDHASASVSLAGTGGNANLPNQVAIVMTIKTATNTRRGRGRMFFVGNNLVIDNTGQASPGPVNALRTALASLVGSGGFGVVSSLTGTFALATSIENDFVADTIRARAQKVATSRSSTSV